MDISEELSATLSRIETVIRQDSSNRGLISERNDIGSFCHNHFRETAIDLQRHGRKVLIATGFFIPGGTPPSAETDGPPGAALLAAALEIAGISVDLVTDEWCHSAVVAAARSMGLRDQQIHLFPSASEAQTPWCESILLQKNPGQSPTHLIAIERAGPSHSRDSARLQLEKFEDPKVDSSKWLLKQFELSTPMEHQNCCHNMRGECIDEFTPPIHMLFEIAMQSPEIRTIGIGDGGNEIGMGNIPWWRLRQQLNGPNAHLTPCRISTNWTILAGVSNWGGQALAAATLLLSGRTDAAKYWTCEQQRNLLESMVRIGPAVDGITRKQEATVDGLEFASYIKPWRELREILGLNN